MRLYAHNLKWSDPLTWTPEVGRSIVSTRVWNSTGSARHWNVQWRTLVCIVVRSTGIFQWDLYDVWTEQGFTREVSTIVTALAAVAILIGGRSGERVGDAGEETPRWRRLLRGVTIGPWVAVGTRWVGIGSRWITIRSVASCNGNWIIYVFGELKFLGKSKTVRIFSFTKSDLSTYLLLAGQLMKSHNVTQRHTGKIRNLHEVLLIQVPLYLPWRPWFG